MNMEILGKEERKIMVAVDDSEESMYALSWCLTNLITQGAINSTLMLLFVKPSPIVYPSFYSPEYLLSNDIRETLEKQSSEMVDLVMKRAEAVYKNVDTNIRIKRMVGFGDPKNVICDSVEKLKADTLVMGSHGYGFFKRALLGSVSDHCAKQAKCPVVIVKRPDHVIC